MRRVLGTWVLVVCFGCGGAQSSDSNTAESEAGDPCSVEAAGEAGDPCGAADPGADGAGDSAATGGGQSQSKKKRNDAGEFDVKDADKSTRPGQAKLQATETEAAVRFFVVNKADKDAPIEGVVVSLTSPNGRKFYTPETDADGFTEVLLPVGQKYELVYLSLGRREVAARLKVDDKPRLNLKLTLRYEREVLASGEPKGLVLEGVRFETGKAKLTPDSHARIDTVVEFMEHKKSARIEISGHTDNVGSKRANKKLSQRRADAVRDYLVSKGIDGSRIKAVGYGDARPVSSNDTEVGRQLNRRIEAVEL